jgi:hypothetical protein
MFEYLATQTTQLGSLGWLFVIAQVAALLGGIYLIWLQVDPHPVRGPLLKRLGYLLVALGAVGVFLGAARLLNLGPLTFRWWLYLMALVELAAAAYVVYYQRTIYPRQMAAYRSSARPGARSGARPSVAAPRNGAGGVPPQPRPEPTTSRRESRRERKRRK